MERQLQEHRAREAEQPRGMRRLLKAAGVPSTLSFLSLGEGNAGQHPAQRPSLIQLELV